MDEEDEMAEEEEDFFEDGNHGVSTGGVGAQVDEEVFAMEGAPDLDGEASDDGNPF